MLKKLLLSAIVITPLFFSLLLNSISYTRMETASEIEEADMPSSWAEACISDIKNSSEITVDKLLSDYQDNFTRADFAYLGVRLYQYFTGREIMTIFGQRGW